MSSFVTPAGGGLTPPVALTDLANIANNRILGNDSGSSAPPEVLTGAEATALLTTFVGDSGSGGAKGLVPATVAGDSAKYLKGDGNFTTLSASDIGTGTFGVAQGGTSQSSFTKGDILAAAAATTLNKLAVGTDGQVLTADAASTNGVKWSTVTSGPGYTPTDTRIPFASGTTLTDDANLSWNNTSRILNLGSGTSGVVESGGVLTLRTTGTNTNVTVTPTGTGALLVGQTGVRVPAGSVGTPSMAISTDSDTGFYQPAGLNSLGQSAGGVLQWYADTFAFFVNSTRLRPLTNDTTLCGADDTRWTELNARHVMINTRTVTADTTLDRTYQVVIHNSGSAHTITLPSAVTARVSCGNSASYTIKNIGAGTVTVAATAGTVEQTSITTGQSYTYISDGTNWYVI